MPELVAGQRSCVPSATVSIPAETYFKRLHERDAVALTVAGEIHFVPRNG